MDQQLVGSVAASATDPHHDTHQALHRTVEAVWRIESARVIAGLTRLTHDVGLAEDPAQDALVAALEQWPSGRSLKTENWGRKLGTDGTFPSFFRAAVWQIREDSGSPCFR